MLCLLGPRKLKDPWGVCRTKYGGRIERALQIANFMNEPAKLPTTVRQPYLTRSCTLTRAFIDFRCSPLL
jgi:hypothetical protein